MKRIHPAKKAECSWEQIKFKIKVCTLHSAYGSPKNASKQKSCTVGIK